MAYNSLGELALLSRSTRKARQYFSEAASSDSPAGQAARVSLLRLDFPRNAGNYIRVEVWLGRGGEVIARISNNAILGVRDIKLQIDYPDAMGKNRRTTRLLTGIIEAGGSTTANLDLGPFRDSSVLNKLSIKVSGAKLAENN